MTAKQRISFKTKAWIICVVLAFGYLLAAILIPNFVHSPRTSPVNGCINNLRQMDGAKQQWALVEHAREVDPVVATNITPYLRGGVLPKCPTGGSYTIGKVGEAPKCSIASHTLL